MRINENEGFSLFALKKLQSIKYPVRDYRSVEGRIHYKRQSVGLQPQKQGCVPDGTQLGGRYIFYRTRIPNGIQDSTIGSYTC